MFLSHGIFSYNTILTHQITLQKRSFNVAKFHGNTILDNLLSQNKELTKDEMNEINTEEKQLWVEEYTNYLSNFEDKLSSGNIRNDDIPITYWRLKRKRIDENVFTPLKTFDKEITNFSDWTAGNLEYEYAIHALSGDIESFGAFGTSTLDFDGWILTNGIDHYVFTANMSSDDITVNTDDTFYDGYTKYPAYNMGERKYSTSRITAMPITHNGDRYLFELATLNNLKRFINDGKMKLLKNSKGEVFWVVTNNFSYSYMHNFIEEPYTVSFSWTEVGDGQNPLGGGEL